MVQQNTSYFIFHHGAYLYLLEPHWHYIDSIYQFSAQYQDVTLWLARFQKRLQLHCWTLTISHANGANNSLSRSHCPKLDRPKVDSGISPICVPIWVQYCQQLFQRTTDSHWLSPLLDVMFSFFHCTISPPLNIVRKMQYFIVFRK